MNREHFSTSLMSNKQHPYSLEAEQSVLGSILIDPEAASQISGMLTSESFYRETHREIYAVIQRRILAAQPIDFIAVLNDVRALSLFPTPEDATVYLTRLVEIVPTSANITVYADIVREKYRLRRVITTFEEVAALASEGEDASTVMELAEQRLYEIRSGESSSALQHISEVLMSSLANLQLLTGENKELYQGLRSGFASFDGLTGGFGRSDLIFLAARPGMGKSALALSFGVNIARQGRKVAVFSLEMSKEQLANRLLSSEAGVSSHNIRTGVLSDDEWKRLALASDYLSKTNMYMDDTAGLTVGDLKGKLRRLRDVEFVIIDYLQLMSSGRRNDNRVQEVSEITRSLKLLAKEFNVPVLVLSQLSRGPESRTNKRPMLSDLRESGSIEQDADIVLLLYRDSYYVAEGDSNLAECNIAKNRHGSTDVVRLSWDGEHTTFREVDFTHDDMY